MAKHKLASITIRPAKNGGHTVSHEFEGRPAYARSGRTSGLFMDKPPAEEHTFGPKEHAGMMQHLAQALALKNALGGGASAAGAAPPDLEE